MIFKRASAATFLFLFFCSMHAFSQSFTISGTLKDAKTKEPLVYGAVELMNGDKRLAATTTDVNGKFKLELKQKGNFVLRTSYMGYLKNERSVNITGNMTIDPIFLTPEVTNLKEVEVKDIQQRGQQKGDTLEINADAYKTNPDANADDLIKKMPGITVEGGTVKAQGENLQKLLVDGKEFFGDDITLALKNLPSEVIDKVQVFDRLSDQAQFTGFNDGNTQKTMNITTKPGTRAGQFGNVYSGYGTDNRYQAGLTLNYFSKKRRISIVGMSNNINQQNFSSQDLMGLSSSGSSRGGRGGGGSFMPGGGGSNPGNFMVGQQGGISITNAFGINYTEDFGKRWKLQTSYFFNQTNNTKETQSDQQFFASESGNQEVLSIENTDTRNFNHRLNARLEFTLDSSNSFIFTPRISFQENMGTTFTQSVTQQGESLINTLNNNQNQTGMAYQLNGDLLWQHKFAKKGRTISVNTSSNISNNSRENFLNAESIFFSVTDSLRTLDQDMNTDDRSRTYGGRVDYSEPINAKSQVMLTYQPSWRTNERDQITTLLDSSGLNRYVDELLTNKLESKVNIQKIGASVRHRGKKVFIMAGAFYQYTELNIDQSVPVPYTISKFYNNALPYAFSRITFDSQSNLRISYRTYTQVPSSSQLQPVIDNSNPLQLSSGNADLDQQFTNMLMFRYSKANAALGRSFFSMLSASRTADFIGYQTIIADADTSTVAGTILAPGSQLTRPVNLDGYWQIRTFNTLGLPFSWVKSNVNINLEASFTRTPGMINNQINDSRTWLLGGGPVWSSNISPEIDYTLGYTANFNWVFNTLQPQSNQNFFSQSISARFNYIFKEKWVFNTDATQTLFRGLSSAVNQQFTLWNASVSHKFLKNNRGELRATVFDILGANTSISRTVTSTFVQDTETNVLTRYFMLTFTYRLRNFKSGVGMEGQKPADMQPGYRPGAMPPGGPPPGGAPPHGF